MNQPDLYKLARECDRLYNGLGDLDAKLNAAEGAAYGEYDEKTEEAIEGTASGDEPHYFTKAREELATARVALGAVEEMIAAAQGYRDFGRAGAVSL